MNKPTWWEVLTGTKYPEVPVLTVLECTACKWLYTPNGQDLEACEMCGNTHFETI